MADSGARCFSLEVAGLSDTLREPMSALHPKADIPMIGQLLRQPGPPKVLYQAI